MSQRVTTKQLPEAIKAEIKRAKEYNPSGQYQVSPNGYTVKPVVWKARISPRKWYVCFGFVSPDRQVGDKFPLAHPEDFEGQAEIVSLV